MRTRSTLQNIVVKNTSNGSKISDENWGSANSKNLGNKKWKIGSVKSTRIMNVH